MIEFKTKQIQDGLKQIHPVLVEIMKEMDLWLSKHDQTDLRISETVTTLAIDQKLKRVSSTHREGRAFDIGGVVAWRKQKLQLFAETFQNKYKHLGAINKSGSRSFMIVHDSGHGLHCHVQIGKDIVDKLKQKYPLWTYPVEKKTKEEKNGK